MISSCARSRFFGRPGAPRVEAWPFETIAAVVLAEPMHFLWMLPDDDHDFPTRAAQLKAGLTRRVATTARQAGTRFDMDSRLRGNDRVCADEMAGLILRGGVCG